MSTPQHPPHAPAAPLPRTWQDGLRSVLLAPWLRWPYVAALLGTGGFFLLYLAARHPALAAPMRGCGAGFAALGVLAAASRNVVVHLLVHVAAGVLLGIALLYPALAFLQSMGLAAAG